MSDHLDAIYDLLDHYRPAWWAQAACLGYALREGENPFFPSKGRQGNEAAAKARSICAGCPVSGDCAEAGSDEQWGVWGGLTRRKRSGRPQEDVHHGTESGWYQHRRRGESPCPECNTGRRRAAEKRRYDLKKREAVA